MTAGSATAQKKGPKTLWLEKLGAPDVVAAGLSRPFSGRVIYYGDRSVSAPARFILALAERFRVGLNVFPVSLSLEKESPDGETLAYEVNEDMLLCGDRAVKTYADGRPLRLKNAIKCYISESLRGKIVFAVIARSKAALMRDKDHILRFERHPMNEMLRRLYEERGFAIKESGGMFEYAQRARTILSLVKSAVKARVMPVAPRSNITDIRPSVWIEYDQKSAIDLAFWKNNVDKSLFGIVYYLDRGDTPVNDEITGEIEERGELWADAHLGAVASDIGTPAIAALIKDLVKPDGRPFWLRMFDFEYAFWNACYAAYFNKFKVKILIQHQDTSWKQEAQAAAMGSAGGIMLGFHWSNYPFRMTPSHLFPYNVFFEWGRIFDDFLPVKEGVCDYWLPSGMWICRDAADPGGITGRLKDLEFTFAVFDSSAAHNVHQTPLSLSRFYLLLLGLLEKNPSWGAVVKSKNGDIDSLSALPGGKDIVRRFRSLMGTDRVFFLDNRLSPATAAALTDLSVCFGLNSAGIVAGAHGNRVLHWDCSGWTKHPFYGDPGQKFIFKTLDGMEDAIIRASKGDSSIGDFSKWRRLFNHFGDFNADKRLGRFIQDVMEMSLKTGNSREILDFAAKRYIDKNGIGDDKGRSSAIIIQARMSSSRFPGKVMSLLGGVPLVEYVYRRCKTCAVDNVLVATSEDTSDDTVYDHCRSGKIPVFRGSLDNVLERYIRAAGSVNAGYVVRVCADTPFVDTALVNTLLKALIAEKLDYASLERSTCASGFYSEAVTAEALEKAAMRTREKEDLEHVTKYITSHPQEFSAKFIDAGLNPEFLHGIRLTIDQPGDLKRANAIVSELVDPLAFTSKEVLETVRNKTIGLMA
ncbi:MAG: NTP transferase domain-containing protein [Candidatus Omnitrophica bacterium]|nr:NTP transferase domain-containing protein [Candidatus Omnitrophota bacterium]MDD5546007.1 NTP transferase domain-containing protein [Candidatus Omnitrophota bacterium]